MMSKLTRRFLTAGSLALGTFPSIGRPRAQEPQRGGTLVATWGGGEPPACYVPSGGGPGPTFTASKVFERLGRRGLDGVFTGELAEEWKPAPDFKSYTIRLRKGVAFHDGKEMSAADVVYSIDEIWKKLAAQETLADYAGCEMPDGGTVVMTFAKPMPEFSFACLMCGNDNYVVPRHVYAGGDPRANPANSAPIGTGPWKFKEWVRGSHVEYARNESYWRAGLPYLDTLVLRFVREPSGRAAALEAGEIQIGVYNPVPLADLKRMAATARFAATAKGYGEAAWATTLDCNLRTKLFDKREVRQAVFHAIDRELIARSAYAGYARPGSSPILSSNTDFFTPDTFDTQHDLKTAATLLDGAGYPKKANGKRFALTLVAAGWFAENARVGAIVKQGLEEVGVSVNLVVPDRTTSIRRLYADYDFDLAISNQADPPEPVPATTRHYTSDGLRKGVPFANASGFHTDEVDALVGEMKIETDPARRKALAVDFQKIITREAPSLPLVELDTQTLAGAKVQNHTTGANTLGASWHDIWLAP
jgi:peptide/nickel transport system substrate-binding protein